MSCQKNYLFAGNLFINLSQITYARLSPHNEAIEIYFGAQFLHITPGSTKHYDLLKSALFPNKKGDAAEATSPESTQNIRFN
ncbi:hypothetical protein [Rhodoflexus caldus]|uniref:hypothetical protein n=1 Tax=Rhodoflexus caldus TaxID=2891236 RepID=UPI00202A533F|nr:hypothetical protein [Rhodoflexus caldus]